MSRLTLILFVTFFTIQSFSQETKISYVDVFVDSNEQIYLEDQTVNLENLMQKTRLYAQENELYKKSPVVYRVYADKKTKMGLLTDISVALREAFGGPRIPIYRYFLKTDKLDVMSGTWQKEVQDLDLKAVEN